MKFPPRVLFALGVVVPVVLVAVGVVLTVFFQVAACPLCIAQRMLYLAVALASALGLAFASCRMLAAPLVILSAAAGGAVAGYQIYLQRNPFVATCGDGTALWERMVEQAGQWLPLIFKADGLCSDNSWSLLGLSIVEWSLLAFSGLVVLGALSLFFRPQRKI